MAAKNEVEAAPAPSGVGKFMADAKLNFFELAILLAFWLGAAILSEYLSLDVILGTRAHKERRRGARRRRVRTRPVFPHVSRPSPRPCNKAAANDPNPAPNAHPHPHPHFAGYPPVASTLSVVGKGAAWLPAAFSVLGLGGMGYMLVKHRVYVTKAVVLILRKIFRVRR